MYEEKKMYEEYKVNRDTLYNVIFKNFYINISKNLSITPDCHFQSKFLIAILKNESLQ